MTPSRRVGANTDRRRRADSDTPRATTRGGSSRTGGSARPTPSSAAGRGGATPVRLVVGHPRRRGRALVVAAFVLLTVLAAQVFRIQGIDAAAISAQALDSRLATTTIPAVRGSIVDANGTVLADSVERRNVTVDATVMGDYSKKVNGTRTVVGLAGAASDIASVVGAQSSDLLKILTQANNKHLRFAYLVKDISPDQWRQINALQIPGVYSETVIKRLYPQGTADAPLIGFLTASGRAGGGVEQMMQSKLNGTPGEHIYERALDGTMIATGDNKDVPAKPGSDVQLTIDADTQWYAANAIAQVAKQQKAASAVAIVIDVKTGEIKALAQSPTYDNNSISTADPDAMQTLPFSHPYEPGSTAKAVTIAAALQEGKVTPTSHIQVPASRCGSGCGLKRADSTFQDSEVHGVENLTVGGVIAQSSNMGAIEIGEKMSAKQLYDYMCKFGMCTTSGIGFPGESAGIIAKDGKWTGSQRYTVMFGQGLAETAIQQAGVFQTLANGGVRSPLKLIRAIDSGSGWQAPTDTRKSQRVVSTKVASEMTTMMEAVASSKGTAPKAAVPGYTIAGKTGTADRYSSTAKGYSGYIASFAGYAPATNPKYVVLVSVEDPKGSIYGGQVAAPVFSDIMRHVLTANKVAPDGDQPQNFDLEYSTEPSDSAKGTTP